MSSVQPNTHATDRPFTAATLLVFAALIMGIQDGGIKYLAADWSIWQFSLLRAFFALPVLFITTRLIGGASRMVPVKWSAVLARTACMVVALFFFFGSLATLSFAQAAAGLYTAPLFVAMLSHLLLRERVGPRRLVAIIGGFAGAMLILQPDLTAVGLLTFLPVGAGAFYALGLIVTRRMCVQESAFTLATGTQAAYGLAGLVGSVWLMLTPAPLSAVEQLPFVFQPWIPLTAMTLAIVAVVSALNVAGHTGMARAYQTAEASFLAPFDYTYLVFATLLGALFWSEAITPITIIGILMIAGGGGYVAWRERHGKDA